LPVGVFRAGREIAAPGTEQGDQPCYPSSSCCGHPTGPLQTSTAPRLAHLLLHRLVTGHYLRNGASAPPADDHYIVTVATQREPGLPDTPFQFAPTAPPTARPATIPTRGAWPPPADTTVTPDRPPHPPGGLAEPPRPLRPKGALYAESANLARAWEEAFRPGCAWLEAMPSCDDEHSAERALHGGFPAREVARADGLRRRVLFKGESGATNLHVSQTTRQRRVGRRSRPFCPRRLSVVDNMFAPMTTATGGGAFVVLVAPPPLHTPHRTVSITSGRATHGDGWMEAIFRVRFS
jgi:hypothetical protein